MEEKKGKLCLRKRWINYCKLYLDLSHLKSRGLITKIKKKILYSSFFYWNYSAEIQISIFTWISHEPKLHVKFMWISRELDVKKFTWISLLLLNSHENVYVKYTCSHAAILPVHPPSKHIIWKFTCNISM